VSICGPMAASPAQHPAASPQQLAATFEIARWLYCPAEVWPYLRQGLRPEPARAAAARLADLLGWLRGRMERVEEGEHLGQPERWRSPGEALWQGSGDRAELALVLWSAAPLVGLLQGRLVIGTCDGVPHTWVEWPELGLFADAAAGVCGPIAERPAAYAARLLVWPPLDAVHAAA
jgi:hypothetical protein